ALKRRSISSNPVDLASTHLSLCIRTVVDARKTRAMLTFQFTVQLLLTFAATIAGGALLFMSIKATPTSHELRRTFLFAGIVLLLSGWAAICFAADINRALAC